MTSYRSARIPPRAGAASPCRKTGRRPLRDRCGGQCVDRDPALDRRAADADLPFHPPVLARPQAQIGTGGTPRGRSLRRLHDREAGLEGVPSGHSAFPSCPGCRFPASLITSGSLGSLFGCRSFDDIRDRSAACASRLLLGPLAFCRRWQAGWRGTSRLLPSGRRRERVRGWHDPSLTAKGPPRQQAAGRTSHDRRLRGWLGTLFRDAIWGGRLLRRSPSGISHRLGGRRRLR